MLDFPPWHGSIERLHPLSEVLPIRIWYNIHNPDMLPKSRTGGIDMHQSIRWEKTKAGITFYRGSMCLGSAIDGQDCDDHFVSMGESAVRWTRISRKATDRLTMRFEASYEMRFQMAPAVMYDQNKCESIMDYNKIRRIANGESDEGCDNNYFKGCFDEKTGKPWRLAWWNMSVPGATYSEGDRFSTGMFLPPDQMDASASVYPAGEKTAHEMLWPEQMGPRVASRPGEGAGELVEPAGIPGKIRSGVSPAWGEGYELSMKPRCEFAVMLVFAPLERPRTAWREMMAVSWDLYHKIVPPKLSDSELWDAGIAFAKRLYCEDDKDFKAFSFGLMWVDGAWRPRPLYRYELGWCGQSVSIATSLLLHALRTGDTEAEQMGFHTLDSWISRTLPTGIVPTHVEEQEYTHYGRRVVDACNLGGGAIQFFFAWRLAQMLGKSRPAYFKAACDICDFALSAMNATGRIGKSWTEDDLSPVVVDGTTGAFLTMALCSGVRNCGRQDYLDAAITSYGYYYEEFMARGFTMGGAQDIFTIDKESAMPLLSAGLALHELTGETKYISCAVDAAWYLTTWQWCYTRRFEEGSSLDTVAYDSFGGTSVSIHGPGNDPYALFFVNDLYDLAKLTGNVMWAQRARAAWRNGADGVSDGTMVVDGRPIPLGGQHEARGLGGGFQGLYQWLVAWPTAFRLENMRRIQPPLGDRIGRHL